MITPPSDGPGFRPPGTQRLPRRGAGVAEPSPPDPSDPPPPPPQPAGTRPADPDTGTAELPAAPAPGAEESAGPGPSGGPRPVLPEPPAPSAPPPPADDGRAAEPAEEPAAPAPKGSRAGRNLTAAIGVGVSLGAVIVLSLIVWHPAFAVVVTAAVLVAIVELTRALRAGDFAPPLVPVLVGAVAMEVMAWNRGATGLVIAFLFTVLAVVLWRLGHGPSSYLEDTAAGVLVALYVPLLAGFAVLLLLPSDGAARVLLFIATVVCNDVGGYTAGVLVGKHPLAPSISPKKSWEGLAGSVLACMLVATLILVLTFHRPWWGGLVFGAALAASATIGDLGESLIKRDLGIKDMGHLLPGHGGIMDRLDSLLPSAVVAYLLLSVLAPV